MDAGPGPAPLAARLEGVAQQFVERLDAELAGEPDAWLGAAEVQIGSDAWRVEFGPHASGVAGRASRAGGPGRELPTLVVATSWATVADVLAKRVTPMRAVLTRKCTVSGDRSKVPVALLLPLLRRVAEGLLSELGPALLTPMMPDGASQECLRCRAPFRFYRRRHHCRACGVLVCGKCFHRKRGEVCIACLPSPEPAGVQARTPTPQMRRLLDHAAAPQPGLLKPGRLVRPFVVLVLVVLGLLARALHPLAPHAGSTAGRLLGCALAALPVLMRFTGLGRFVWIYSLAFLSIGLYWVAGKLRTPLALIPGAEEWMYQCLDTLYAPLCAREVACLGSVFVKLGQGIGGRSDVAAPAWVRAFSVLHDAMPPDTEAQVRATVREELRGLGKGRFEDTFPQFDFAALASASIGQVHAATLRTPEGDRKVAVKVQHRGIDALFRQDCADILRIIGVIAWLFPEMGPLAKDLAGNLVSEWLKELDLTREASNLTQVRAHLGAHDVVLPAPLLASRRLLVMEFVDGFKVTRQDLLDLHSVDTEALMRAITEAYAAQLLEFGLFNADPHAGNVFCQVAPAAPGHTTTARPVLLDFGMTIQLPTAQRLALCRLAVALRSMSPSMAAEALAELGYENKQSAEHPERDLEFFAFLLRDTADADTARGQLKEQVQLRKRQRKADLAAAGDAPRGRCRRRNTPAAVVQRQPTKLPESFYFIVRVLGLVRGLCTELGVSVPYLQILAAAAERVLGAARPRPSGLAMLDSREVELQVCVLRGDDLVLEASTCGAGVRARFPLLELSKLHQVAVVADLVREERLKYEDRVSTPDVLCTVRELLEHRAEVPPWRLGPRPAQAAVLCAPGPTESRPVAYVACGPGWALDDALRSAGLPSLASRAEGLSWGCDEPCVEVTNAVPGELLAGFAPAGTGVPSVGLDDAPGHVYDVGVVNTARGRRGEVPDVALYGTALQVCRLLRRLPADAPGLERWKGVSGQSVCGGLGHMAVRSGDWTACVLCSRVSLDKPALQVLGDLGRRFHRPLAPDL